MPEIDGHGSRTPHPGSRESKLAKNRCRILALTANAAERTTALPILNAGMDGILLKPLDRQRLSEIAILLRQSCTSPLAA